MDLARAIGKQMGYKVEIVSMGFDALIPALNSGNIDVVAAGMSINEERQKAVTFSEPYYTSGLIVMVNKDNNEVRALKIWKANVLPAKSVLPVKTKSRTVEGAKVKAFNTQDEASLELKNGGADAVIGDAPVIEYYMTKAGKDFAKNCW